MTLTIHLTPVEEARLAATARKEGLEPSELARKFVTERLPLFALDETEDPTLALFAQWDREDAEMTPEEQEEAGREFEQFKQEMNAERARAGARILYP